MDSDVVDLCVGCGRGGINLCKRAAVLFLGSVRAPIASQMDSGIAISSFIVLYDQASGDCCGWTLPGGKICGDFR